MNRISLLLSCAVLVAGAAIAWQRAASVTLPPPYATQSSNNRPQVVPRPEGAQLTVPKGFQIEEYASGFDTPRYMAQGPSGEILLSDSAKGAVYIIGDAKKDLSKAGERKVLVEGLKRPYGIAFWKEFVYIAETESLKRYPYDAKAMKVGPGQEVVSLKGMDRGHWTRTVLFNAKGDKMYLGVGSSSNVDPGDPRERAAINRYNPDGTGHEIYAAGTRNPIGLRLYPGSDVLWAAVQERDLIGDDLVPDYFTHIQQGGFYGWPYAYFGPHEDPRPEPKKPDLVAKTITPDVAMGSHVAVLDFIFYTGKQFPAEYQGGAFVAEHGSWNRSKRVGYGLAFVPFKGGKPSGDPKPFLTGWMLGEEKREVWGRPVGLFQLSDGSILVTDDGGKKIWRISYKG